MLRVSYLKPQPRQNWVASIKARRDKHSTAGVSLTSELEREVWWLTSTLPGRFQDGTVPRRGLIYWILSWDPVIKVILSDFFFSLMRENWMFWMFAEVDFFFFFAVYLYRECWREWECWSERQVPAKFNHFCSKITWFPATSESWNHKLNSY